MRLSAAIGLVALALHSMWPVEAAPKSNVPPAQAPRKPAAAPLAPQPARPLPPNLDVSKPLVEDPKSTPTPETLSPPLEPKEELTPPVPVEPKSTPVPEPTPLARPPQSLPAPPPTPAKGAKSDLESSPFMQHARSRIYRLQVVSPELVRGGQPDSGGLYFLKKAGIKTIINLREIKNSVDPEGAEVRMIGLNYVNIPMSHTEPIPQSAISKFLSTVKDPLMQPVFIHCQQGADRTGSMCAIYRIDRQGWTPTQAYREMLSFNFHPILRNLTASVYGYGAKKGRYEPMPPMEDTMNDLMRRAQWLLNNI